MIFRKKAEKKRLPRHVAIIMDGNGRWAQRRFLPRSAGHRAGMERMIGLARHIFSRGIPYITLYALSAENLSRPKEEVDALFGLFRQYFSEKAEELAQNRITLRVIGDRTLLPDDIVALIEREEARMIPDAEGVLVLAIAYGGRQDILHAANAAVSAGGVLTEESFSFLLSTRGLPPPDLLIRTGKEKRLSNFLLFESAYTELYFSDKMFPAFSDADLDRALRDYQRRDRRFGKLRKVR